MSKPTGDSIVAPLAPTSLTKTPMVDLQKTAGISLKKHGLEADGTGGVVVYLVLDHSGSMANWYRKGAVQRLTEQVIALASKLDSDGKIQVWFFSSDVGRMYEVGINDFEGWVDSVHNQEPWGLTNYASAMEAVAAYHREHGNGDPGLVVFQTDGSPNSRPATNSKLRELAPENLFFAFVGFGSRPQVDYLFTLDELEGRVRDNASALAVPDFTRVTDETVYDGVLGEFVANWLPQVL